MDIVGERYNLLDSFVYGFNFIFLFLVLVDNLSRFVGFRLVFKSGSFSKIKVG